MTGLMNADEWRKEKERRQKVLDGLSIEGKKEKQAEWEREALDAAETERKGKEQQEKIARKAKAESTSRRYDYAVARMPRDGKNDGAFAMEAQAVINKYAADGWRLHTYSQMALGSGAMAPISSSPFTNVLHLVFEREL
jgi:hypothetical protein